MGHKTGRKRKQGKREANGRLSRKPEHKQERRAVDDAANMRVAREYRERIFGVKQSESGTELAGTAVGRLLLREMIDKDQHEAAKSLVLTYTSYLRAIDAPPPPRAVAIGIASSGSVRDVTPEQAIRYRQQWADAVRAIQDANSSYPGSTLYAACDYLVLRDEMHPHLIGDLRLALNALVRHYGLLARAA